MWCRGGLKVNIPLLVQALWCESCLEPSLHALYSSSSAHGFKVQIWVQTIIDIVSQEYFIERNLTWKSRGSTGMLAPKYLYTEGNKM